MDLFTHPDVVESDDILLSTMSSTDFAGLGWTASKAKAAEASPPIQEGRRGSGDTWHRELDLVERKVEF